MEPEIVILLFLINLLIEEIEMLHRRCLQGTHGPAGPFAPQ